MELLKINLYKKIYVYLITFFFYNLFTLHYIVYIKSKSSSTWPNSIPSPSNPHCPPMQGSVGPFSETPTEIIIQKLSVLNMYSDFYRMFLYISLFKNPKIQINGDDFFCYRHIGFNLSLETMLCFVVFQTILLH